MHKEAIAQEKSEATKKQYEDNWEGIRDLFTPEQNAASDKWVVKVTKEHNARIARGHTAKMKLSKVQEGDKRIVAKLRDKNEWQEVRKGSSPEVLKAVEKDITKVIKAHNAKIAREQTAKMRLLKCSGTSPLEIAKVKRLKDEWQEVRKGADPITLTSVEKDLAKAIKKHNARIAREQTAKMKLLKA